MDSSIGQNIRRLRVAAGLTQEALANRAEIKYTTLTKIESGSIKRPSAEISNQLAKALSVPLEDLLWVQFGSPSTPYRTTIKGLVGYQMLLEEIGRGTGDIIGYSNLKYKIQPETLEMIRKYRDAISSKDRVDRFIVPNSEENIALVESESQKEAWKKSLRGRFIPEGIVSVKCDLYVWDGKVGVCTFENGTFDIKVYDDPAVYALYKQFLELLWGIALDRREFFGPRTSLLTKNIKEAYELGDKAIDLADGSPRGVNPDWVKSYQLNASGDVFYEEDPNEHNRQIGEYFLKLLGGEKYILTSTSTLAFVLSIDTVVKTPGDEVIIMDPTFDSYANIIRSQGGNAVSVDRDESGMPDVGKIAAAITSRTVAVVVCNPDNPLGLVCQPAVLDEIVELCVRKKVALILDYSFYQVSPYGKPITKPSKLPDKLSYILIGDTGKILGLNGTKVGVCIYSANLANTLNNRANNYFYYLNEYDLHTLSKVLADRRYMGYVKEYNELIAGNLRMLQERIDPILRINVGSATSLALIDVSGTGLTDVKFAEGLKARGLVVVPLSYFYNRDSDDRHKFVRVSLARPNEYVGRALGVINGFVGEIGVSNS